MSSAKGYWASTACIDRGRDRFQSRSIHVRRDHVSQISIAQLANPPKGRLLAPSKPNSRAARLARRWTHRHFLERAIKSSSVAHGLPAEEFSQHLNSLSQPGAAFVVRHIAGR